MLHSAGFWSQVSPDAWVTSVGTLLGALIGALLGGIYASRIYEKQTKNQLIDTKLEELEFILNNYMEIMLRIQINTAEFMSIVQQNEKTDENRLSQLKEKIKMYTNMFQELEQVDKILKEKYELYLLY